MRSVIYSETDVAYPVVEHFRGMDYDVYQEVQVGFNGRIADIVAVMNKRVAIIECKTSLSLAVIEQAYLWQGLAHWIFVAVPPSGHRYAKAGYHMAKRIMEHFGLGVIESLNYREGIVAFETVIPARLNRKANASRILKYLHDAQKTYAQAGNAEGRHWSPFKRTCYYLEEYVIEHPGCAMREALKAFDHHYSSDTSAVQSLVYWISEGKVPGLRLERDGKAWLLYPTGQRS